MPHRIKKIAKLLVNHSASVKPGEIVRISALAEAEPLAVACHRECLKVGGIPTLSIGLQEASYNFFKLANKRQLRFYPKQEEYAMKMCDAYIALGGVTNTRLLSSIPERKLAFRRKLLDPIRKIRLKKKWVLFHYPTNALAQDADMSLQEFTDFVYDAALIDYNKLRKRELRLKRLLDKADDVLITGENTELRMRIKGRNTVTACGENNVPDGECFTAPLDKSANGVIEYDFPAIYSGREVSGIRLEFRNGKVVKMRADKNERLLKKLVRMDRGASRLGELGIGMNPKINHFTKQILFDEKIMGTVHLALGDSYKECGGRNRSALHWDMIKDLRKRGELVVDGRTIIKSGKLKI